MVGKKKKLFFSTILCRSRCLLCCFFCGWLVAPDKVCFFRWHFIDFNLNLNLNSLYLLVSWLIIEDHANNFKPGSCRFRVRSRCVGGGGGHGNRSGRKTQQQTDGEYSLSFGWNTSTRENATRSPACLISPKPIVNTDCLSPQQTCLWAAEAAASSRSYLSWVCCRPSSGSRHSNQSQNNRSLNNNRPKEAGRGNFPSIDTHRRTSADRMNTSIPSGSSAASARLVCPSCSRTLRDWVSLVVMASSVPVPRNIVWYVWNFCFVDMF